MKLTVGQKVWFQPSQTRSHHTPAYWTVVSVGRKWATLATEYHREYRLQIGQVWVDAGGYQSPGRIWESREAYESAVERDHAWRKLRSIVGDAYSREAAHLTTDRINEIIAEIEGKQ